ncbi:MAG: GGDEF domain-containing protein [Treponema sp.]|nr:GGDEF domain-containing protein [Treponema sp.]
MDNSTYKEIVSKISTPLIIGRPVFDEATGKLKDAEAIFANEEFKKYFKDAIEPAFFLSEKIDCLTKEVEWFEAIEKTLKTHQPYEMTFFSPMLSIWLLLKLDVTSTNLIILTFTDVSQYKEYEQTLKRQNLRLAALTEEITVSGEELKRKLQNIEELNRKLEFNAYHDSLTGIFNRTKLSSDLEEILAESAEKNEKIGVILIDIDNLKLINDSQGHIAGDDIIKQSVQILQSFQKPNLIPYRFDGDEFIIIVREVSSRDYLINLGDAILEHFNLSGIEFSAGVSLYPDDGTDKDELLRYADMAMNDVKKKGKNNVFLFEEIMRDKFMTRLNLQVHLNEAIEKEIFVMYFQPQFNVATGELR